MKRPVLLVVALACVACELLAPPPTVLGDGERREGEGEEGEGEEGEEGEGDGPVGEGEGEGEEGEGEGDGPVGEGEGEGDIGGCTAISAPGVVDQGTFTADVNGIIQGIVDLSPTPGAMAFEAYAPVTVGTDDLGSGSNDNYATCNECLRMEIGAKNFFQTSGTVVLDEDPLVDGHFVGQVFGVTLVEVTFSAGGATSTPVPGGDCFELSSWSFDFVADPG